MQIINRVFSLRPGDFGRGLPFFAYYFLIITAYTMGRVARDPIFLDHFKVEQLPYADIAVATLAGVIVAAYIRAGRRANVRNLQVACLLLFAVNLVALWWALHVQKQIWAGPVFYVWFGICGILTVTQVWTLANFVWTTREAKRLFSMLGSGGIVGGIAGGFLASWVARRSGTDALLLVMAASLVVCAGLVRIIWTQRPIGSDDPEQTDPPGGPRTLLDSFRLVRQSPHLQTISALILLASIVTTVAGWQFKAIAKHALVEKDAFTAFQGVLYGYTGLASLVAQLLITTRLLRRFGVGVALLLLPLCLTASTVTVAVWGTLWAATLLKVSDGVVRYSIDTSAVQLLYLPVAANIKLQVKSFVDTVVWKLGDGLAGLTLLIFATTLHFTARQVSWVTLVLLGAWLVAAVVARRHYVATLRQNIQQVRIHPEQISVPTLDQFTTSVLAEKLSSTDPNEVLYVLTLFDMGQQLQSHGAVRHLLAHPSPAVRKQAISILTGAGDRSVEPQVGALLRDEDLDVRTEALRYLTRHHNVDPLASIEELGDFAHFSIRSATIAFLAKPGDAQNVDAARVMLDAMVRETGETGQPTRVEAARLIASLPDQFEPQLGLLMTDADPDVLRQALRTAGLLRKRRFVPAMIEHLGNPTLASDAIDALARFEDGIVGTLGDHLNDSDVSSESRQQITQVLLRIGTAGAGGTLAQALLQNDLVLRYRIICALNKLQETCRDLVIDRQLIETVMIAELMGHYRSYQILGAGTGGPDGQLKKSMTRELERIFRLMKLLFPSLDLKNAYTGIHSESAVTQSNALEFLDNTLNPQLRSLLVPLLDHEVGTAERIRLADRFLGFSVPQALPAPPRATGSS